MFVSFFNSIFISLIKFSIQKTNLRNQISLRLWHIAIIDVMTPIIPAFLAGIVPFQ